MLISNYCRRCPGTNSLLANFPGRTLFFDSVSFAACGPCRSYFGHAAQFQTAERLILVLRRQLRHSTDRNPRSNALLHTVYNLHTTYHIRLLTWRRQRHRRSALPVRGVTFLPLRYTSHALRTPPQTNSCEAHTSAFSGCDISVIKPPSTPQRIATCPVIGVFPGTATKDRRSACRGDISSDCHSWAVPIMYVS